MKEVVFLSKEKHLEYGTVSPQSFFEGGCPFAKDTSGKEEILKPTYTVYPYSLTVEEIVRKCPVFGKGVCPYKALADEMKGIAANCPGFKNGCPFKNLTTMGEYVGKLAQMRDTIATPKGRAALEKLMMRVHEISKEAEKKAGPWPFPPNTCPIFAHDAHGKRIMPKYN